jgi:hypothetical protein
MRFTQHAIDRYRQRTGSAAPQSKIERKLEDRIQASIPIGSGLLYGSGWVFVMKGDVLITVYKPKARWIQERIHKAKNPHINHGNSTGID